ncbi:hypothetical protein [Embleya sp. NPDC005971]|uniref:hypothetical protein n=1 Tax=Embleya sp. NPDC005971 TaxID=3156724 RepID=UPI0033F2F225
MVEPIGPTMAGGTQKVNVDTGWSANFYPDANNHDLMEAGKSPVYYWLPTRMSLARNERGDYRFNLMRFAGSGKGEEKDTVGGVLSLTTTGAIPAKEWQKLTDQVIKETEGHANGLWYNKKRQNPTFMPVIVTSNTVSLSNLKLNPEGYRFYAKDESGQLTLRTSSWLGDENRSKLLKGSPLKDGDIGNWYWVLQGGGNASLDPSGETAFVAMVGNYPAQLLYTGFNGTSTGVVFASSAMQLQMWTPKISMHIHGNWKKIYEHFSTHTTASGWFVKADIKTALDDLKISGGITVELKLAGAGIPGVGDISATFQKHSDLIVDKFLEQAQRIIFEPQHVDETPAETSSGISPWGFGFALKKTMSKVELDLDYKEEAQVSHLQTTVISSSLTGILRDEGVTEDNEKKYFPVVYLDDWPEKLARVCTPFAAWGTGVYSGLSVQIGYPNDKGELLWDSHVFDPPAASEPLEHWVYRVFQKSYEEVKNPPPGWEPDRTFVKRAIHFAEPDPANEYVVFHLAEGHSDLRIDPEPNGTATNERIVEVRASANAIMTVNVRFFVPRNKTGLTEDQFAELTLEPVDADEKPIGKEQATFFAEQADLAKPRVWKLCPAPDPGKQYRYQIKVTDTAENSEWTSAWKVTSAENLMVAIPKKNAQGVTFRFRDHD